MNMQEKYFFIVAKQQGAKGEKNFIIELKMEGSNLLKALQNTKKCLEESVGISTYQDIH